MGQICFGQPHQWKPVFYLPLPSHALWSHQAEWIAQATSFMMKKNTPTAITALTVTLDYWDRCLIAWFMDWLVVSSNFASSTRLSRQKPVGIEGENILRQGLSNVLLHRNLFHKETQEDLSQCHENIHVVERWTKFNTSGGDFFDLWKCLGVFHTLMDTPENAVLVGLQKLAGW
jgi:hypothetical protein